MRIAAALFFVVCLGGRLSAPAAEVVLDFGKATPGPPTSEYRAALTGGGPPPEWQIVRVAASPILPKLIPDSPSLASETVLAQVSTDSTDERFPLLIYEKESFDDFTATLRFRTVDGKVERMAGLAFRLQNETNYYVVRASSLGNTFRFYKFVDGQRSSPIGPEIRIPSGEWHTLEVNCRGNEIRCRLDERDAIPPLNDTSFTKGKLAFWTKSDSVSHFGSLRVVYEALKTLPQRLVDGAKDRYPRLLGVAVYAEEKGAIRVQASSDAADVGKEATASESRALREGMVLAGATREGSTAVFPIRDRNGDPLFVVKLRMRSFAGQTDNNVAARARPIVEHLEKLARAADHSGN